MAKQKYRLVTRSDFDGLVCAVLLKELDLIDEIKFVHPKDMQDGKIAVIVMNLSDTNAPFSLWMNNRAAKSDSPAHSIMTLIISGN